MNTRTHLLDKLQSDLRFKNFFEEQASNTDYELTLTILELFEPYMTILKDQITKEGYELAVHAFVSKPKLLSLDLQKMDEDIILFDFCWEPLNKRKEFIPHEFNPKSLSKKIIDSCLAEFSRDIGITAELFTDARF